MFDVAPVTPRRDHNSKRAHHRNVGKQLPNLLVDLRVLSTIVPGPLPFL